MNNQILINQTLQEHIKSSVEHFADDISTPQTYFFLSMLFLQSVGFMEQKISCILWEIGYREHLERFRVFDDYKMESIEYNALNRLYQKLQARFIVCPRELGNVASKIQNLAPSSNLNDDLKTCLSAFQTELTREELNSVRNDLTKILHGLGIEQNQGLQKFQRYLKNLQPQSLNFDLDSGILDGIKKTIQSSPSLFEQLEYNFSILEKELDSSKKNLQEQIKILKEQRNFLAHFKSFYPDKSIISFCAKSENNKLIRFEHLLFYLAILIKLDETFMEAFECYRNDYENS